MNTKNMKELSEKESLKSFFSPPNSGEMVTGKIIGKQKSGLFFDLGVYGTGLVAGKELVLAKQMVNDLEIGQDLPAKVLGFDNEGYLRLSIAEAQEESAWRKLKEQKQNNASFTVSITKANKGGLMAEVNGITGFLPVSQLKPENYPKVEDGDQSKILQKLQKFIGENLKVVILSLDPKQKNLILSEKEADMEKTREALKEYQVGDTVKGVVTGVVDFGAFIKFPVDKDGKEKEKEEVIEGLIHISELDWQLIQDPADVVQTEEIVEAKIIDISNGRVSLSLKALKKDPWEKIDKKYKKGDFVEGTVTKFNPFGAFVQIEPKVQGLIHISEFEDEKEMKAKLELDKNHKFEISLIEPQEHRMILTLAKDEQ